MSPQDVGRHRLLQLRLLGLRLLVVALQTLLREGVGRGGGIYAGHLLKTIVSKIFVNVRWN